MVVTLKNQAGGNLRLNTLFLDRAKAMLKVRDSEGRPINPGSPGMPPRDPEAGRKVLKPQETLTYKYTGLEYFGGELAPGNYQVCFRYEYPEPRTGEWGGTLETEWLDFEVKLPLPGRK